MKKLLSLVNGAVQTVKGYFVKAKKANEIVKTEATTVDNSISTISNEAQEVLIRLMVTEYHNRSENNRNFVRVDQENNNILLSVNGVRRTLPYDYDISNYIRSQVIIRNNLLKQEGALQQEHDVLFKKRLEQYNESNRRASLSYDERLFTVSYGPGGIASLVKRPEPLPFEPIVTGVELDRILEEIDALRNKSFIFKWEKTVFQNIVKHIDQELVLNTIQDMLNQSEHQLNVDIHQTA